MAVTFILGRAGTGKTRACLDELSTALADRGDARHLLFIIPEQASFQMERALALRAPGGGFSRAMVLSFSRLAQRVVGALGAAPELLAAGARGLAIRALLQRIGPELPVLRSTAALRGFPEQVATLLEHLIAENISPAELTAAAATIASLPTRAKATDLARLYEEYLQWLGPTRVDAAARLALLRARLDDVPWLQQAAVWVDGFAGFTGQECLTLVELGRRAAQLTITLLLDADSAAVRDGASAPDPLGLFARTETTYHVLRARFAAAGVVVAPPRYLKAAPPPRFAASPELVRLEHGWAQHAACPPAVSSAAQPAPVSAAAAANEPAPAAVRVHEFPTHRDELRAAAHWIRSRIADSGGRLRFRDFAVIARQLDPFADLVTEVFREYEVPFFLDRRRPLRAHPLAALVPALCEVALTDFDTTAVVTLLRTRLLPLTRDQAERLENVVVGYGVRGQSFWSRPTWRLDREARDDDLAAPRVRIVAALAPLVAQTRSGAATGDTWATLLCTLLDALDVRGRLSEWMQVAHESRSMEHAEVHRLAWETLCGVLADLRALLGTTPLTAADVAAVVGTSLESATVGLAPPAVDQVLVSGIERSRHPDIRHAWLFGFNQGVFPAVPPDDAVLSAAERTELAAAGLDALRPRREDALAEPLLAYIALTRPSHELVISFAAGDDAGGELAPSAFLGAVLAAVPGLAVTPGDAHPPPTCVAELARGYLRACAEGRDAGRRWRCAQLVQGVDRTSATGARLTRLLRGVKYRNAPPPVGSYRRPAGDDDDRVVWSASPSEIETYLKCPFQHFATFGLRLDAERGPSPLRWDLGALAHDILAGVTRRAIATGARIGDVPTEQWDSFLDDAIRDYWRRQPADSAATRPDLVFFADVLTGFVRELLRAHVARWRRGAFTPQFCEVAFAAGAAGTTSTGARGAVSANARAPLLAGGEVRLDDGRVVRLRGQIDRIDVIAGAEQRLALIYDYKSKADALRGTFLTGARLQLMLYLAVLQDGSAASGLEPAGVLLAPLYPNLKVLDNRYAAEATADEQLMYMYRPRGLLTADAAHQLDAQLGSQPSPVAQLRLCKNGDWDRHSDVIEDARLADYLDLARATTRHAAAGVQCGDVGITPLVENRTLACRFCEFGPLCRFDRSYNQPRAAEQALPQLPGTGDAGDTGDDEDAA